jgi:hypothetical protein
VDILSDAGMGAGKRCPTTGNDLPPSCVLDWSTAENVGHRRTLQEIGLPKDCKAMRETVPEVTFESDEFGNPDHLIAI